MSDHRVIRRRDLLAYAAAGAGLAAYGDIPGLAEAAAASHQSQSKLAPEHLSKMRLLWSFLRLWMEWQYAWSRWTEFHDSPTTSQPAVSVAENRT